MQRVPQSHFGPQLQGWHKHCLLEHLSVILGLLNCPRSGRERITLISGWQKCQICINSCQFEVLWVSKAAVASLLEWANIGGIDPWSALEMPTQPASVLMEASVSTTALGVGAGLAAGVGVFAHVIGYDRDRSFYAAVLTVVGALYVLYAVIAGGSDSLMPELAFFAIFAAMAATGFRTSLWVVVAGLALHGVFDLVRFTFLPAPGAPEWWPAFCGSYDVVAALGLATLLVFDRSRAARHTKG